ncbi:helix-turn-helix domain-containing protein [Pseudonocardia sp.]|uniref:helix-turn-helix domain-containing protein n=1 Tax=Pseudonocardia sp. TaxID=60912 RepID=UPI003D0A4894
MADSDRQVPEDWDAVARAIQDRLAQTRMTQMDVASRAQVSITTLRELQHNLSPRRRRPQTLAAVSEALGWPSGYLDQVLRGEQVEPHPDEVTDPVLDALNGVETELRDLRERVAKLEARLNDADARP